jgi:hypothetical protein
MKLLRRMERCLEMCDYRSARNVLVELKRLRQYMLMCHLQAEERKRAKAERRKAAKLARAAKVAEMQA